MPDGNTALRYTASNDNRATLAAFVADEIIPTEQTIGDVIAARLGRRDLMKGPLTATAVSAITSPQTFLPRRLAQARGSRFGWTCLAAVVCVYAGLRIMIAYEESTSMAWFLMSLLILIPVLGLR